jgi:hypothetical protein
VRASRQWHSRLSDVAIQFGRTIRAFLTTGTTYLNSNLSTTISKSTFAAIVLTLAAALLGGCDDTGDTGDTGAKGTQGAVGAVGPAGAQGPVGIQGPIGVQGPAGVQGPVGTQGVPAPDSTGTVYVIPGSGGISGGGYLTLNSPTSRAQLLITCNYGSAGDDEAFWFAGSGVVAGSIAITNEMNGEVPQAFNDLAFNQGGQDRATIGGSAELGAWPWHGVFTVNDGGTLSRWDATVTGTSGGACTAVVYANNGGTAQVSHP